MKVYIDSACNFSYSSFYIRGLMDLYGKYSVCFSSAPFKGLLYGLHTHVFAFVVDGKKYVIDFADSNEIFYTDFLKWTDVYAKVNYNSAYIPSAYKQKIVRCGCNYSMAIYSNKYIASFFAVKNWMLCRSRLKFSFMQFMGRYIASAKRKFVFDNTISEKKDYIFFVSTLWKGQDKCNQARINFIRACHNLQDEGLLVFEGGLIPDKEQDVSDIEDVLLAERIPYEEYALKLAQSFCAFNTPAYYDCHGWKLAEYIAMGKIILSTTFVNDLPHEMENNTNIIFCDNSIADMQMKIRELIADEQYRTMLKRGVKEYYIEHACPKEVVKDLIENEIKKY